MNRMIKTFFCPPDLCLFSGDVIGSSEINSHQTYEKLVKNLYKTYAGWTRLDVQDCKIITGFCSCAVATMLAVLNFIPSVFNLRICFGFPSDWYYAKLRVELLTDLLPGSERIIYLSLPGTSLYVILHKEVYKSM